MPQRVAHSHAEAVANAVIGSLVGQGILWIWGLPLVNAMALNATFIAVSYARAFILRRTFEWWERKRMTEDELREWLERELRG